MTVSIARLSADAGVKYLLKTTAHGDMSVKDLTDYYTKSGNPRGIWLGAGVDGIGVEAGAPVTDAAAKAVFEQATNPVTGDALGRPHGHRTVVHPVGQPGAAATVRAPVAGFDLTFSVPKSVSVLWALGNHDVQGRVLAAHHRAVQDTLQWLETKAIHTRAGHNGVARVPVRGAVAAAFDHWESRAGDPQLHTHLVIANRVRRITDGAWTSLDARTLYQAVVAASEHYNGLLFDELQRQLGTVTEVRAPAVKSHNFIHELAGIDPKLIAEFSTRAKSIELEKDRLVATWIQNHGHAPSDTTVIKLRQQATLATRSPKSGEPTPLRIRLLQWRDRAERLSKSPERIVAETIHRSRTTPLRREDLMTEWLNASGQLVQSLVAQKRSTWNRWNLLAEAERVCAEIRVATAADRARMIDDVATAAESCSVALNHCRYSTPVAAGPDVASNDRTVFDLPEGRTFSDVRTLSNEDAIMAASTSPDGPGMDPWDAIDALRASPEASLHSDQQDAALQILSSRYRVDAITGPAGTGKTSIMKTLAAIWQHAFGQGSVVALAPSAVSADVLATALGLSAENVAKWLHETVGVGAANRAERYLASERVLRNLHVDATSGMRRKQERVIQTLASLVAEQGRWQLHANQLVIVDEASMVSTYQLAALTDQAQAAGAKVLLVGDPAQLDSIDAGGILGWLDRSGHAARLTTIHRFSHAWEREACLQLRNGDFDGIHHYQQHGRIKSGNNSDMADAAYAAWNRDLAAGRSSILIAPDNDTVNTLNQRAQADLRSARMVDFTRTTKLSDGSQAGRGDVVLARQNNRHTVDSRGDYIRNGTLLVMTKPPDRSGNAWFRRQDTGANVRLDATYLSLCAELGYATTAHRAQGITVETSHSLVSEGRLTRELFYVSMTRGRNANTAYVVEPEPDDGERLDPTVLPHWPEILGRILAAEGAERTAHETREHLLETTDTLEQIAAEHDYLTQILASDQLINLLSRHAPSRVAELQESPSWGPAVTLWKRLLSHNRILAERTVLGALTPSGPVRDQTAILHSRLSAALGKDRHAEGLVRIHSDRKDIAALLDQVEHRLLQRTAVVASRALTLDHPWKQELVQLLQAENDPKPTQRVLQDVAVFRDRWGVTDETLPLGPQPSWEDIEMTNHRHRIEAFIAGAGQATANPATDHTGPDVPLRATTSAQYLGMGM
ncbi:MobF family relaxase [Arthrobacter sp. Sr24]